MAKWQKTYGGYRHIDSGAVVEKRTEGNPHRNGDWFLTVIPKGWYGCTVPATGVSTLRRAKQLVEAEHARHLTMTKGDTVKTMTIDTPHGPKTVASVTYAGEFYGLKNYYTHVYNSMGQRIWGGSMFVEGSKLAEQFGL